MPSTTPRPMSQVDGWALRILASAKLGLNPAYVQEATNHLSGKPIAPMMGVAMCREASAINHRIAFDESAAAQANEGLSELMSSYGICPPGCNH